MTADARTAWPGVIVVSTGRCGSTMLSNMLRLMIDPLVAGGGKRLFRDDGALRSLRLAGSQVTSTGAIIATYAAAGG